MELILGQFIIFLIGLILLYLGAEYLVKSSSLLAKSLGVRTVTIGLTIVAFGTSAPELFVSLVSALKKAESIALGNIIGSNIANIGLVLGLSAIIRPLKADLSILKKELPIMIFVSLVLYLMALDLKIVFLEGLILFSGIVLFTLYSIHNAKIGDKRVEIPDKKTKRLNNIVLIILGLFMIILGANLLIKSAIFIAKEVGISEYVIGLTAVAIGTSLPEMAVSLVAAYKKEGDICIGNVVGSNIFNILLVLGVLSMITPLSISPAFLKVDFPIMLIFSFALIPLLRTGFVLSRVEGLVLLAFYISFILYIFCI